MKISLKHILAVGALAVASTSAFADIALPSTGNGELSLVVLDTATGASYFRGLQIDMNNVATQAQVAADTANTATFSVPAINLSADANLQAFLSAAGSDAVTWGVVGGAYTGNAPTLGNKRYVSTASLPSQIPGVTNQLINGAFKILNANDGTMNGYINTGVANDGASGVAPAADNVIAHYGIDTWSQTLNALATLGSSANFYLLSSTSAGTAAPVRAYQLQDLTLSSNGTLTSASGSTVTPIPAAIWLLGSGLAGLVGIGRRKQVA